MATQEFSETPNVLLYSKMVVIGNCKVVSSEKISFVTAGFHKNQEFLILYSIHKYSYVVCMFRQTTKPSRSTI